MPKPTVPAPKSVHTARYAALLRLLAAKRAKVQLTQAGLGKLLGKPQSYVSKVEKGERRLDVIEYLALCRALGADPYSMLRAVERIQTVEAAL